MRGFVAILVLTLSCSSLTLGQQREGRGERVTYVKIPPENIMVLMANQPNCPLKLEEADYLIREDASGWAFRYKVRNVSSKPIRIFTAVAWYSAGGGGTLSNPTFTSNNMLMPGETLETIREGIDYRVVPMTNAVRKKLMLGVEMSAFWVLMIDRATFEDGSTFDDSKTSEALSRFLASSSK